MHSSNKVQEALKEVKIIKYAGDKYCYFYSVDEIEDCIAIVRIREVQNMMERKYVPFISKSPKGSIARKAFVRVLRLRMLKLIQTRNDANT